MHAVCTDCGNISFIIFEDKVLCGYCKKEYQFSFIDDFKILCETNANDLVKLINEGD